MIRPRAAFASRVAGFLLAAVLLGPAPLPAARQVIAYLKDGATQEGALVGYDGNSVTINCTIGTGTAKVPFTMDRVEKIFFALDAKEKSAIDSPTADAHGQLESLWNELRPYLELPESPAAEAGIALARLLARSADETASKPALDTLEKIEAKAWNPQHKQAAKLARIAIYAQLGQLEKAQSLSADLGDPGIAAAGPLAEALLQNALARSEIAWAAVRRLETEWPKWEQMPKQIAERKRLLDEALDGFLLPAAMHPEFTSPTARGLYRAAEIFAHLGKPDDARARLREIIDYFPDPEWRERAQNLIKKLD